MKALPSARRRSARWCSCRLAVAAHVPPPSQMPCATPPVRRRRHQMNDPSRRCTWRRRRPGICRTAPLLVAGRRRSAVRRAVPATPRVTATVPATAVPRVQHAPRTPEKLAQIVDEARVSSRAAASATRWSRRACTRPPRSRRRGSCRRCRRPGRRLGASAQIRDVVEEPPIFVEKVRIQHQPGARAPAARGRRA